MNKLVLALLLFITQAHAQTQDGTWLNSAIQASDRVNLKTGNDSDAMDALNFLGFVSGILAAQRSNTTQTKLTFYFLKDANDEKSKTVKATALMYCPLCSLPDKVDGNQVIGIIKKYVADNPKRWNESAYILIIDALKDAYPVKVP